MNLHEQFELVKDLLEQIPDKFRESYDSNFALGAALQAAHKLLVSTAVLGIDSKEGWLR